MYKELSDRLKKVLNFRGSAVAVALSNDRPELEKPNEKMNTLLIGLEKMAERHH